ETGSAGGVSENWRSVCGADGGSRRRLRAGRSRAREKRRVGTPARYRRACRESRRRLTQCFAPARPAYAHRPANRWVNDLVSAEDEELRDVMRRSTFSAEI